ncbi:MAG: cytidylyltransferase domain-containing protein [Nitrosopumilaceae archaeon]
MNKKKITALIQTRIQSTRLPNKVLALIENRSLIWYIIERLKNSKTLEQIVLTIPSSAEDRLLIKIAEDSNVLAFIGDENDVLGRFYNAAVKFSADPIIRITGDCPLVDPYLLDKMVEFYLENNYDYVSNTIIPTYPDGLDIEVFSFDTLSKAFTEAKLKSEREHVTPFIWKNPTIFRLHNYENTEDQSNYRWCVDEPPDLDLIRLIYSNLKPKIVFPFKEVIRLMESNPELLKINDKIKRNEGYLKSIRDDTDNK